ncbi:MAG: DUF4157 domain-containing protein, partial [Chloroflexi bacterium]|nr:DUF4157 domain-containing protein [Chloroflexota bacterium]
CSTDERSSATRSAWEGEMNTLGRLPLRPRATWQHSLALCVFGAVLGAGRAEASVFGDIVKQLTGIEVNVPRGEITIQAPEPQKVPQSIAGAIERAPELASDVARAIFNPAGQVLADAIRHAEGQARFGAQPLPPQIQEALAEFFPPDILSSARWHTVDGARITLADLTLLHNNDTAAVTVGHVVVFDRGSDAQSNDKLWAHELVHVLQYRQMGIDAFAHSYVLSGGADVEDPAYRYADAVEARLRQRRAGDSRTPIRINQIGDPRAYARPTGSTLRTAAMEALAPTACLDITTVGGQRRVSNGCDIPIWVHSFVELAARGESHRRTSLGWFVV